MKQLTDEGKRHLGTQVDNMHIICDGEESFFSNPCIYVCSIKDYNPSDPDSPYAMKYLSDLVFGLSNVQINTIFRRMGSLCLISKRDLKIIIQRMLEITGYTGKVWEE